MNKGERAELRRIIRHRFKVLRADIDQRKAELEAELEARIKAQFAAFTKQWEDAQFLARQITLEANRKLNDLYRGLAPEHFPAGTEQELCRSATVQDPRYAERQRMRHDGLAQIDLKCRRALAATERREAEILEQLAVGGLESDDAKSFLAGIPTVGELVPASRLAQQLEAGPD